MEVKSKKRVGEGQMVFKLRHLSGLFFRNNLGNIKFAGTLLFFLKSTFSSTSRYFYHRFLNMCCKF